MGALRDRLFASARFGDAIAIDADDGCVGYLELARRTAAAAGVLVREGVRPGDRVALLGPPSLELVIATLAVQCAGAIAVPLNPRYQAAELAHVLGDSGATRVRVFPPWRDRIASLGGTWSIDALAIEATDTANAGAADDDVNTIVVDDEDIALLVYTSGTTGRSKGVALPWRALVGNMEALTGAWGLGPHDRLAHALPLFHVHGLCIGIYGALLRGTTILLHARFDPAAIVAAFRERGATVFMGVPTMYVQLLEHLAAHPDDATVLAGARLFTAGSAALSPAVLARFEQLTGHRILERYGMTETLITLGNPLHGERRAGSVGRPVPGVEIRIVDDDGRALAAGETGELQVRGDSLMRGYWGDAAATAAAFDGPWFRTGDVALADDDGYVRIVGRRSTDIVKSGGFKLSTQEIEDALREHPAVADVAVIGVADERWGEHVTAVVVPRPQTLELAALREQLVAHTRARLADYKCPRQLVLLDALPRNAMGKLEKAKLRATIERDYPAGDADLRAHTR